MQAPRIRFAPVQLKSRHDGWTPARQRRFIEMLTVTKCISKACRAVGMSSASAYKLRDRPEAGQFRLAWRNALEPEFTAERRRSPRALQRLRLLDRHGRAKVDETHETHDAPVSAAHRQSTSSALETLQTYLALLRGQDQQLGSPEKG